MRVLTLLVSLTIVARADDLRRPARLTAGPSNQLLGVLSAASHTLYYVDDASTTTLVAAHDLVRGAADTLFDDLADATMPRPSPDGRAILYLSQQTDAAGQLCVRALEVKGRPGVGDRVCVTAESGAALQGLWWPDGKSVLALVRSGFDDDLRLERYAAGGGGRKVLLTRNLSSPTLSADGRWLAYVPLARGSQQVGPSFASRASRSLALQRLDDSGMPLGNPLDITLDQSGASAFPAFSPDGKWLYFTHYLDDTNHDGELDGEDHAVILRAPFNGSSAQPIDTAHVEQLTSAAWDCRYPSPAPDRLVVTCGFEGALHVYGLPLDGAVPPSWSALRIDDELAAGRSRREALLLLSRKLALEADAAHAGDRARDLAEVMRLHLALDELEAAGTDVKWLAKVGSPLAPALAELVGHRLAQRAFDHGQLDEDFVAQSLARAQRLPHDNQLADLVRSEILDGTGDKSGALAVLRAIDLATLRDPFVLRFAGERFADSYRLLDDRRPLTDALRTLAGHPALDERTRLGFAGELVNELVRGRPPGEHARLLDTVKAPAGSTLAMRVALERALIGLATMAPAALEGVKKELLALYEANPDFERRRTLVAVTERRAEELDDDSLLFAVASAWVKQVGRDAAERRHAEALFRDVELERGYAEEALGHDTDALAHYDAVTRETSSLEAHAAFLDLAARDHKDGLAILRARYPAGDGRLAFAAAFLATRELPLDDRDATLARIDAALEEVRRAAPSLDQHSELQHLWAWLAHARFLRHHERVDALTATTHELLAIDLASTSPRMRAVALEGLALVEAEVENHALALEHIAAREQLPFARPVARLAVRLIKTRALMHVDRDVEAAQEGEEAVKLIDKTPGLARWRPLALDRTALAHLSAGQFTEARERYDELLPTLDKADQRDSGVLVRLHLARAAACVGEGRGDLARTDLDAARTEIVKLPDDARVPSLLLLEGLDGHARELAGDDRGAQAAYERKRALLDGRRRDAAHRREDLHELAIVEGSLARIAWRRKDAVGALLQVEAALAHLDEWSAASGTQVDASVLALVESLALLHLRGGVPLKTFTDDPATRLRKTLTLHVAHHPPEWERDRRRLAAYFALLSLEK